MNLQQAADEAMAYLDSVGVAAEYDIELYTMGIEKLTVTTDDYVINIPSNAPNGALTLFMEKIIRKHPQKSPA